MSQTLQHESSGAPSPQRRQPAGALRRIGRTVRSEPSAVAALIVLSVMALVAVLAPWVAPHDPLTQDLRNTLLGPFQDWTYPLGTDDLGRDVLSRLIHGARISLLAPLIAMGVAWPLGVLPGILAGYVGGRTDGLVMRVADTLMAFPPIILAVGVIGVLGPGLGNAMFAIGIVYAPRLLRLIRASIMTIRREAFTEAAWTTGASHLRILRRHVLPNSLGPLIIQTAFAAAFAMLAEAGLSFLGLGVQPPAASWGAMLGRASEFIYSSAWFIFWPGVAIAVCVLALNVLGESIRRGLDTQQEGGR